MESLPDELVLWAASYLTRHSLTQLALTCKRVNKLITPTIWVSIELHEAKYHLFLQRDDPSPVARCAQLTYMLNADDYGDCEPGAFSEVLRRVMRENNDRLKLLCECVRELCADLDQIWDSSELGIVGQFTPWQLLPYFGKLRGLEIHGACDWKDPYEALESEDFGPPLRLHYAKLSGYIPRKFAVWILGAKKTLQHLDLDMLDRPISSALMRNRTFRPLPSENLLLTEDGDDYDDLYEGSDNGSLDGEYVIPRPLSGFMSRSEGDGISQEGIFPVLKYLCLRQPCKTVNEDSFHSYSWSTRADERCIADWRDLLLVCGSTLETLIIEQRPGAEEIEMDTWSSAEYVAQDHEGSNSEKLVSMLLELLQESNSFESLQKVVLYGIMVGERAEIGSSSNQTPGATLMRCFQKLGIACEARLGEWCLFRKDGEVYERYGSFDPEIDEEHDRNEILATV